MLKLNVQATLLEGLPNDAEDYNAAMYMVGSFSEFSGSSKGSSSTLSGSISNVQGSWSCYIYFRSKHVSLPPCELRVYMKEVRIAHCASSGGDGGVVQESEVQWFKFGRFRKFGTLFAYTCLIYDLLCYALGTSQEIVVRGPKRGNIFTHVACGADARGLPSIGRVLGILHVRNRAYIILRWLSPTFLNSNRPIPRKNILAQQYRRLVLTNTCAVVQVDQLVSVCHVVPEFDTFNDDQSTQTLYYVNNRPLGTTLRNKAKENLYACAEGIQEPSVSAADALLQKTFELEQRAHVVESLTSLSREE